MSEEVTRKEMLSLFNAVTAGIQGFGPKTPAICNAIRGLIMGTHEERINHLNTVIAEKDAMIEIFEKRLRRG